MKWLPFVEKWWFYLVMFLLVVASAIVLLAPPPDRDYERMSWPESRSRQAAAFEDIAKTLRALCEATEGCEVPPVAREEER